MRDPAARDRLLTEVGLPPGSEERTRFEGALPALEAELRAGRGLPPGTDDAVLLSLGGKLNGEGGWGVGGGGGHMMGGGWPAAPRRRWLASQRQYQRQYQ